MTATHPNQAFVASASLTDDLQAVLIALLDLGNQSKQAHWAVVGPQFRSIHLELDDIVAAVREHADTVAERLRALEAMPDGRTQTIYSTTPLEPFPVGEVSVPRTVETISARLVSTANVIRRVHDDVDDQDPTSADILHSVLESLEKQRWMLASQIRQVN